MNEQEYIKTRIDNQFEWYNNKSTINKNKYQSYKLIVIILSVSIPFMTGFITEDTAWLKIAVGLAGIIIAIVEGIQSLYKYQDNWLLYRTAAEFLTREKIFYTTKSGPYQDDTSLQKLVARIESFTNKENEDWMAISNEEKEKTN
jgi:hypothetical protein